MNNNYIETAFIPPVHANQLISSGHTFSPRQGYIETGPRIFVTGSDNMTKLSEFCFKIEIEIKIRVP